MRWGRTPFWIPTLLLAFGLAAPASATTVTVQITGTWDTVDDTAGVLDGSITVGGSFTATLVYDDSVADANADPNAGEYDISAASSDLSFTTGNYSFVPSSGVGIAIDDNNFGQDAVFLLAESYTVAGPFPSGVSTGGTSYTNATLIDTTETAHSTDQLTGLPWSIGAYDFSDFYFYTDVLGAGSGQSITLEGTISNLSVLPEPSTLTTLGLGFAALTLLRWRRG